MRTHRKYERVDNKVITVQSPALTPRKLMDMVANDIEFEVKARKGSYGNGSEEFPIPRSMNISLASRMATKSALAPALAPAPAPAPAPALAPAPAPAPAPALAPAPAPAPAE